MNPDKHGYWQENKDEFRSILHQLFGHQPTGKELDVLVARMTQEERNKLRGLVVKFLRQSPKWSRKVACVPYL